MLNADWYNNLGGVACEVTVLGHPTPDFPLPFFPLARLHNLIYKCHLDMLSSPLVAFIRPEYISPVNSIFQQVLPGLL